MQNFHQNSIHHFQFSPIPVILALPSIKENPGKFLARISFPWQMPSFPGKKVTLTWPEVRSFGDWKKAGQGNNGPDKARCEESTLFLSLFLR